MIHGRWHSRVGLWLAVALTAAGCHGGSPQSATTTAATTTTSSPASCGVDAATARRADFTTADGVRIAALAEGDGDRGVVLVPEAGRRGKCGWTGYAAVLARQGIRVLMFDERCQGESACPTSTGRDTGPDIAAAVDRLHSDGAKAVVLVGASAGATAALSAVADTSVTVRAVVALSADELAGSSLQPSGVHVPVLMAVAQGDRYVSVDDTQTLFAVLGTAAQDKKLEIRPATSGHGWDMLSDSAFSDEVTAFVTANLVPEIDDCLKTADARTLGDSAYVLGSGQRTVVLSNQSDENLCSWLPYAHHLTSEGYRVVLWDYGSSGPVDGLTAIVAALRTDQPGPIILIGASKGAKTSLIAAAGIKPPVTAVVSLSAESVLNSKLVVADYVKQLTCPVLLLTSEQDPYGSAPDARTFQGLIPNLAHTLSYPGSAHGTELLTGPTGHQVTSDIDAFLSSR